MSKYRLFRVVAESVDDEPEDKASNRLTLDLFMDESGRAVHRAMTFGFMGSAADTTSRFLPFGIRRSGALVDWTDDDNDTSDERLNIFGKQIRVGELFTRFEGEHKAPTEL